MKIYADGKKNINPGKKRIDKTTKYRYIFSLLIDVDRLQVLASGHNSAVEYELPKLGVAGSNPVARSFFLFFCALAGVTH